MKFKNIAAISFTVSFLMMVLMYVHSTFVPYFIAKKIFLFCGIIALFFNLLSYKEEKNQEEFNLLFWIGTIILFLGLYFKIAHWPYSMKIIYIGIAVTGVSFFYSPNLKNNKSESSDILDNE
jgi:hypothetical protein